MNVSNLFHAQIEICQQKSQPKQIFNFVSKLVQFHMHSFCD